MLQPPPTDTRMYAVLDLDHEAPLVPRPVVRRPSTPAPALSGRRKLTLLAPAAALAVLGAAGAGLAHHLAGPAAPDAQPSAQLRTEAAPTVGRHAAPVSGDRWIPVSRSAARHAVGGRHRAVVPPPAAAPSTAPSVAAPSTPAPPTHSTSSTHATLAAVSPTPSAAASPSTSPAPSASPTQSATPSQSPSPTNHGHKSPTPSPSPSGQQGPVSTLLDPVLQVLGG